MSMISSQAIRDRYSPLYFLATLGSGGLMVTFFMYLMFWVPHPAQPVPIFEDIMAAFAAGGLTMKAAIAVAYAGIAVFAYFMFRTLIWNLGALSAFRRTDAYTALRNSNAETQMMAIPLALGMVVNGCFIIGMVFVPGLWSVVEYLFPIALIAFLAIGFYGFGVMRDFYGRVLIRGGFDCARNNSFAQILPAFAFAMIGVGLAAPAAMSTVPLTAGIAYILSSFFIITAILLAIVNAVLGLRAMMEHGASEETAPTLVVIVPLVTIVSIAMLRHGHGLHEHFGSHTDKSALFTMLNTGLMIQLAITALGVTVLRRFGYVAKYVTGAAKSAGSYALVCPGVALSVMGHFYLNKGLVAVGLVEKFSPAYIALSAIAVGLQVAMIWLVFKLNAKHLRSGGAEGMAVPEE